MLRVSKLTDYATAVMACLVEAGDEVQSAQALAERARLALPTVSKVLKQLAQAGLVVSERGIHGGYRLARPAARITVADIVVALEGPIGMTECSVHAGACGHESHCGVRVNWQHISKAVVAALEGVTLADMVKPPVFHHGTKIPLRVALS
jgi:FeS assembly SUF system regulator